MKYNEIKKIQKLIKKQYNAYTIGLLTESENKYDVRSEKFQAFNIGRIERIRRHAFQNANGSATSFS